MENRLSAGYITQGKAGFQRFPKVSKDYQRMNTPCCYRHDRDDLVFLLKREASSKSKVGCGGGDGCGGVCVCVCGLCGVCVVFVCVFFGVCMCVCSLVCVCVVHSYLYSTRPYTMDQGVQQTPYRTTLTPCSSIVKRLST